MKSFPGFKMIPDGLAARSAKAQSKVLGDEAEPEFDRIIVTQDQFYPYLRSDISRARERVVIYSAFLTVDRITILEPSIRAAYERGVMIYVVTKSLQDRNKRDVAKYPDEALELRKIKTTSFPDTFIAHHLSSGHRNE